jgi:hypothetical protein
LCCSKVTESYIREIGTKFCYCSCGCFLEHSKLGQLVIGHRARAASEGALAEPIRPDHSPLLAYAICSTSRKAGRP